VATQPKSSSDKSLRTGRHVLVVEDERDLAELLQFQLERAGHLVTIADSGIAALRTIDHKPPDLILLDLMLPELSGIEVASRLRTNPKTASIPIIMLTAKTDEVDQVVGLTVGADDYITKPFSVKVVLARIDAVLRRAAGATPAGSSLRLGPITISQDSHEVTVEGEPIRLTLTEFRILAALAAAKNRVLSRHILMSKAMGPGVTVTERTIDVHVTAIRRKLGEHGALIRTVRGVGYRATAEPEFSEA
jgi:two-component system phosphate regulon response regulator PhoB